jgi:hypothetical protein
MTNPELVERAVGVAVGLGEDARVLVAVGVAVGGGVLVGLVVAVTGRLLVAVGETAVWGVLVGCGVLDVVAGSTCTVALADTPIEVALKE